MHRLHMTLFFALLLLVIAVPAWCLEREITVETPWKGELQGLHQRPGRWGQTDLVLDDGDYEPQPDTELLMHFDQEIFFDITGNFSVTNAGHLTSSRERVFGERSAAFQPGTPPVVLSGPPVAGPTDFSIEFWLYPVNLADGEQVLSWKADRWDGEKVTPQAMLCSLEDRVLHWSLENMFLDQQDVFELDGLDRLLPRTWSHHMLRYQSSTGLLEYLVDGLPQDINYVTERRRDGAAGLLPLSDTPGVLTVGGDLTGLMDELRISHKRVTEPQLDRYHQAVGVYVSGPLDLEHVGTRLLRVESVMRQPGRSAVFLFYRIADDLVALRTAPWQAVQPGDPLQEDVSGQWVQLRAELRPDELSSPAVSRLTVVYQPDLPPPPPAYVVASSSSGTISLRWRKVLVKDVAGYLIYYGERPGTYSGVDGVEGSSPVDVGDTTEFTLTGLENGKLYYLSVVSYDGSYPAQQSTFSKEVAVRPSALGQSDR